MKTIELNVAQIGTTLVKEERSDGILLRPVVD
jgi:hypothetical protein